MYNMYIYIYINMCIYIYIYIYIYVDRERERESTTLDEMRLWRCRAPGAQIHFSASTF